MTAVSAFDHPRRAWPLHGKPLRATPYALAVQRVKQDLHHLLGHQRLPGEGARVRVSGYRFEAGRRLVRAKSLMALRDKVRARTPRNRGGSIESVIASLNPTLKGWFAYFKQAHRFTFSSIDGFVRRRLRAMLRKQKHRPLILGCSRYPKPINWRANPGAETTDWRARRGRLHSGFGGRGRREPFPTPIHGPNRAYSLSQ